MLKLALRGTIGSGCRTHDHKKSEQNSRRSPRYIPMNPVAPEFLRSPLCLRFLPFLAFGSGCASLIYEIVWFQFLQLTIGSTAVSMGILLAAFMGGLCLGSKTLPRLLSVSRSPLRSFALLEFGIGLLGLAVLFLVPSLGQFYAHYAGHGLGALLLRSAFCVACVLPATTLMGATFPCLACCSETSPIGLSWLGFVYAAN